jgi:oxalate decarboxylase
VGQAYVADVNEGELWIFPPGYPHSLQGIGENGTEFIIAFNEGRASEFNTLLVTDFLAHTPPEILAQNFQVPAQTFSKIPTYDRYIFQGELPGPLAADQAAVLSPEGAPKNPFSFSLKGVKDKPFFRQGPGGTVQIADSRNFLANTFVAASLVTLVPGGLRELHWHPNADEWQYYIKGAAQVGVFTAGPRAQTQNFHPGRHRLRQAQQWSLCQEHGQHRVAVPRGIQKPHFPGRLLVRLVDAHAARDGRRNLQYRPGGDREVAQR